MINLAAIGKHAHKVSQRGICFILLYMTGEKEEQIASMVIPKGKGDGRRKPFDPSFLTQLPNRLQNSIKLQLNRLVKHNFGGDSKGQERGSSAALEIDLDRQLQAWRENPYWADPTPVIKVRVIDPEAWRIFSYAHAYFHVVNGNWLFVASVDNQGSSWKGIIKVSVPKGSLCNLSVKFDVGLPPDAVYDIVTDPDNRRVFKNIKEVISRKVLADEGMRQVVELEQAALWKFFWWSGTISVHVLVDQNREDHTMKFKQIKTGFMKKFEGCWKVEPAFIDESMCYPFKPRTWSDYYSCTEGRGRIGSIVSLEQLIEPALVPPPPISWYLRGITARTTEMIVNDLLAEAARIRGDISSSNRRGVETADSVSDQLLNDKYILIKERWARQRRNAKRQQRRLLTIG